MRWSKTLAIVTLGFFLSTSNAVQASDYFVYSIYRPLDLGGKIPKPDKDLYINMGSEQGLEEGSSLQVFRRISTYDVVGAKLYQDVTFPIAIVRVIHVERNAAVARVDRFLPSSETPSISPKAVMVGDFVKKM